MNQTHETVKPKTSKWTAFEEGILRDYYVAYEWPVSWIAREVFIGDELLPNRSESSIRNKLHRMGLAA